MIISLKVEKRTFIIMMICSVLANQPVDKPLLNHLASVTVEAISLLFYNTRNEDAAKLVASYLLDRTPSEQSSLSDVP